MRNSNDIKNLLDIQDPNITFSTNCVEIKPFKGRSCKFIKATLTYTPTHCALCGRKIRLFQLSKMVRKLLA